jgi:hypothetical protein
MTQAQLRAMPIYLRACMADTSAYQPINGGSIFHDAVMAAKARCGLPPSDARLASVRAAMKRRNCTPDWTILIDHLEQTVCGWRSKSVFTKQQPVGLVVRHLRRDSELADRWRGRCVKDRQHHRRQIGTPAFGRCSTAICGRAIPTRLQAIWDCVCYGTLNSGSFECQSS